MTVEGLYLIIIGDLDIKTIYDSLIRIIYKLLSHDNKMFLNERTFFKVLILIKVVLSQDENGCEQSFKCDEGFCSSKCAPVSFDNVQKS